MNAAVPRTSAGTVMPSLIQQRGLYYVQFYSAHRKPQRVRVPLRTRVRRDAERHQRRVERAVTGGTFDPWTQTWDPYAGAAADSVETSPPDQRSQDDLLQLGTASEVYLASCSHLKPYTIRTYREIIRPFVAHAGGETKVSSLTSDHVLRWLDSTCAGAVTRRKYNNHLGYLFRYLVRLGVMDRDLSAEVKLRRVPESAPKSLTPEHVAAFIETALAWPGYDYRWLADLCEANVELGMRRGELLALRPEHVNLEERILLVRNTGDFTTKSGKERAIPVSTAASMALSRRIDEGRQFVFEPPRGPIRPDGLSHAFRRVRTAAGLPYWANLHSTRHTALTRLAERGVPVEAIRQFAGHSSITVTERYMRFRPDLVRDHVLRALG